MADPETERPASGRPLGNERGVFPRGTMQGPSGRRAMRRRRQAAQPSPIQLGSDHLVPSGTGVLLEQAVVSTPTIPVRIALPEIGNLRTSAKLKIGLSITGHIELIANTGRAIPTTEERLGISGAPNLAHEIQPVSIGILPPIASFTDTERSQITGGLQLAVEQYYVTNTSRIPGIVSRLFEHTISGQSNAADISRLQSITSFPSAVGVDYGSTEFRLTFEPIIEVFPPGFGAKFFSADTEVADYTFNRRIRNQELAFRFVGHVIIELALKKSFMSELVTAVMIRLGMGGLWAEVLAMSSGSWRLAIFRMLNYHLERTLSATALARLAVASSIGAVVAIVTATAAATAVVVWAFGWIIQNARDGAARDLAAHFWATGFMNRLFHPNARSQQEQQRHWYSETNGVYTRHGLPAAQAGVERADQILSRMNLDEGELIEHVAVLIESYDQGYAIDRGYKAQIRNRLKYMILRGGETLEESRQPPQR